MEVRALTEISFAHDRSRKKPSIEIEDFFLFRSPKLVLSKEFGSNHPNLLYEPREVFIENRQIQ